MYFRLMRKILALITFCIFGVLPLQLLACGKNKVHSIEMERTPCFGKCPWYKVRISENGAVKYWGKKDAPRKGYFEGMIDASVAKNLMKKFSKKKILNARSEYTKKISDVPMIHYLFTIGKNKELKLVRQANFGPEYFTNLAKEIDQAIANIKWIRADDEENE